MWIGAARPQPGGTLMEWLDTILARIAEKADILHLVFIVFFVVLMRERMAREKREEEREKRGEEREDARAERESNLTRETVGAVEANTAALVGLTAEIRAPKTPDDGGAHG